VLLSLATTAACSSSNTSSKSDGTSGKFVMQFVGPPISLNPALAGNGGSSVFTALSYDPLIYLSNDGKLVPDLATSWTYVGDGNKTFELTLRQGVKFTDGTDLTADAVVASMKYFLKAGGSLASQAGAIDTIEAVSPTKVRITYKAPNPDAAMTMTQYAGIGSIIGPKGLADPKSLLTSSDGTGAYVYDKAGSVTNDHYHYTKNPHYFAPKAQTFSDVTVRIIPDPQAVLSAAKTGQIQFAGGAISTADSAKGAGLKVMSAPFFNWSLILGDTKGVVSKPLADPRVRQAIAYALDRKSLASALGGKYAAASGQVLLPNTDGYVSNFGFEYDLAKAKSLMSQAGYANGFAMTILTESLLDKDTTYSQAVAEALKAIGIKVKLQVESTGIGQFIGDALSKKYPAVIFPSAGIDMFQLHQQISAGLFNPFGSTDHQLDSILAQAFASSGSQRTSLYQQASRRYNELAWVVPMFSTSNLIYASSKLANVGMSAVNPNPMPEAPSPDLAWHFN
jgi:peptide/nickel transport system substrate-binding protein